MRDLLNHIDLRRAISPAAAGTDNTAIVSQIIDRAGYESLVFGINIGANTDTNATFAVTMDHGDAANLSDAAAVPASSIGGGLTNAAFTAASDDNKMRKVSYMGSRRYVRLTITPTGNDSGNIFVAADAILSGSRFAPTANPPA
jgi:hypothetical protein